MDAGVLLLHGLFEHKGRHQINSDWFENLNISPHSIDLPGHGEETTIKGHIDSWEENNEALKNGFRNLNNHTKKIVFLCQLNIVYQDFYCKWDHQTLSLKDCL